MTVDDAVTWDADEAITQIYAAHYRSLVRLAALLLRDVGASEEVVQDSFIAMHGAWRRLRDPDRALAYLRQSVVNRSRSVLRHRTVELRHAPAPMPDAASAEHGAMGSLEHQEVIVRAAPAARAPARGARPSLLRRPVRSRHRRRDRHQQGGREEPRLAWHGRPSHHIGEVRMTPPRDRDGMTDDLLETRLRRALNTEASMVNPSGDGLGRIRAGIAEEQSSIWWRRPALALVAAAFLGLAVGGVAVALSQNDDKTNLPAGPTTESQTTAPETTEAPTTSPSNTTSPQGSMVNVPVYFVADDGRELRLYREFHRTALQPEGKIATAVDQMFGPAVDPDYSSSWPETTKVLSVSKSGDTATVNLSAFPSTGADAETKAVQQLVYTVTATDNSVKKVRLLVNGKAPQSGHSDWSQPVARASMLDVQGWIWILTPTQGSTVGSPVKVSVYGSAFEGTVTLQVFKGDTKVAETFVTTAMGMFREASTTIPLDPGRYELRAFESSAQDGSPLHVDTKTFTVK